MTTPTTRRIGEREVFPIGMGCMPLSLRDRPPAAEALRTIHAALDAGANLLDTADAYARDDTEIGHNERLIARALEQWSGDRDAVLVATKGGHVRDRTGAWLVDGRPEHLRAACEASLRALRIERIGLYQYHRPDAAVPYAESIGALRDLQREGKVAMIGISNASTAQIDEAREVAEIVSVQNELSLGKPGPLEHGELAACARDGLAFLPWSPLGGIAKASDAAGSVEPVAAAAEHHGVSPQQVALAWLLSLGEGVIPIPGSTRPETIVDSLAATTLDLDPDELSAIGDRVGAVSAS